MLWLFSVALASPDEFHDAIGRMQAAVAEVDDATFVLHQREYVGGRWGEPASVRVRYRPPNTVYAEWANGQRMLWDPVRGDKMRVDPPYLPPISLSPDSALARRGQRHTVRRMGLVPVVELFGPDIARIQANDALRPTVTVTTPTVYGKAARCFDASMRKDLEPALYAYRVEVCLDSATWLPLRMRSWDIEDGEMRQVEEYGYEDLRVNVGLTDSDFDAEALGL
jgi:hypothetical protein